MKKKLLIAILTLSMFMSVVLPTFAVKNADGFDISDVESSQLDVLADTIYKTYGIEAFVIFDDSKSGDEETVDLAESTFDENAKGKDGVCLAVTEDLYYFYVTGKAKELLSEDTLDDVWKSVKNSSLDYNFVAKYYIALNTALGQKTVMDMSDPEKDSYGYYVVDKADLLSDTEEQGLESKLEEISTRQDFDVVVVTVDSIGNKTPMEFADDYYDYNGYGKGTNKDGCLLLLSMEDRDWYISTHGYGIDALTDAGIEYISDEFVSYLSDEDYLEGFTIFGNLVDEFVTHAKTDKPYDVGSLPKKFEIRFVLYGLIAGLVIAIIVVSIAKSKLKSVRSRNEASEYLVQDSLLITTASDRFIGSHISRVKKAESNSGGSSTHTSSSGSSHGGGGGKF